MALVAACAVTRNSAFAESVKIVAFQGKSLLRPQAKVFIAPSATMITKAFQEPGFRAKPWPYKEKGFSMIKHYWYEKTLPKFNENTKIIVVEGLECSGKTTLAKQIAEDFDLHYVPEPSCDQLYTNEYGYNLRELNPQLPPYARFINKEDFFMEPSMRNATNYFHNLFQHSFMCYVEGMAHLLNTGQGVVMDRNYYSTVVDMLTLVECGWIRPEFKKYHNDCTFVTLRNILRPHLVIYLDVPPEVVKERIKKRGIDYEVESKVLSNKYLTLKDKYFKEKYLQDMSPHCEMLIYDWSNFGDAEVVSEDIEQIDFDKYGKYDQKLDDWRVERERQWGAMRENLTSNHLFLLNLFNFEICEIPEMWMSQEDWEAQRAAVLSLPTEKYAYGFNAHLGDKNILFKDKYPGWKHNGVPM